MTGPAVMPSGGFVERFLYSWKRRFWATEDMVDTETICTRRRSILLPVRLVNGFVMVGWLAGASGSRRRNRCLAEVPRRWGAGLGPSMGEKDNATAGYIWGNLILLAFGAVEDYTRSSGF